MAGTGTIGGHGNSLRIDQSSTTGIVDWNSFSIGAGERVRFDNGAGATLNRVGGNVPSTIDGRLSATGSLYLVNPAGVVVGAGGRVATGGSFVASTLDVGDSDFLAGGALTFRGSSAAAATNAGVIRSAQGDVALIARQVENSGTLAAPHGTAALAAGYEVLMQDQTGADGQFAVEIGGPDTKAVDRGTVRAAAVEMRANGGNVYALAGNTRGIVKATGIAHDGGHIFLTAGGGTVKVGGRLVATRRIPVAVARGRDHHVPHPVARRAGAGGDVRIAGGTVALDGFIDVSGKGAAGGTVVATGTAVSLGADAAIDAGGTRGGTILLGGDRHGGSDPALKLLPEDVADATTLTVAAGATIAADGRGGDGGNVVLWSGVQTDFAGAISARGSGQGSGGFAEVSSAGVLSYTGAADLTAAHGTTGTLLLDPENVTIADNGGTDSNGALGGSTFAPSGGDSILDVGTLEAALTSADVVVTTGSSGSQAGDITVAAPITWSANTLTLDAFHSIAVNAALTANGAAGLALTANDGGSGGIIGINAPITIAGSGAVDLEDGALSPTSLSFGLGNGFAGSLSFTGGSGAGARLSIDGTNYTLLYDVDNDATGVQGIAAAGLSGHYALATDIDASGTATWNTNAGFAPLGSQATPFSGVFEGLGHTVSDLMIARASTSEVGLFGVSTGALRDVGLVGASIAGASDVGALVGWNETGSIANAYAAGAVSGSGSGIGGLVGESGAGSGSAAAAISGSYATASVTGSSSVGGLIGEVDAKNESITNVHASGNVHASSAGAGGLIGAASGNITITDAYATGAVSSVSIVGGLLGEYTTSGSVSGTISQSYATGAVTAAPGNTAGGLVGQLGSSARGMNVTDSYATGAVRGTTDVGGLVGINYGAISDSYATGAVHAGGAGVVGGFVGVNEASGTVTLSYWDTQTSGTNTGIGQLLHTGQAISKGTASLQGTLPSGLDNTIWGTGAGLYPYFLWQYPTTPQAISGTAYSDFGTTLLASGGSQTNSVSAAVDGTKIGQATTGANGYFYLLAPDGTIGAGSSVLAYPTSGTGATLRTASAAGTQRGLLLYGGAVMEETAATTLSTAPALTQVAGDATAAAGSDAGALAAIAGAGAAGLFATNAAGFTIDEGFSPTGANLLVTTTRGAPLDASVPIDVEGANALTLVSTGAVGLDQVTVGGGSLSVSAGSGGISVSGTLLVTRTGTMSAATATGGTFAFADGVTVEGDGSVTLESAGTFTLGDPILVEQNGSFTASSTNGDLTLTGQLTLQDSATGDLEAAGALSLNGVAVDGGTLTATAGSGLLSFDTGISVNGGSLSATAGSAGMSIADFIEVGGSGSVTLTSPGSLSVGVPITVADGGSFAASSTGGDLTVNGSVTVEDSATASLSAAGTLALDGTVGVSGGGTLAALSSGGDVSVAGPVTLGGTGSFTAAAPDAITVAAPITVNDAAGLTLDAGGALTIDAPVTVTAGGAVALDYDNGDPANLSFGLTAAGFTGNLTFSGGTAAHASLTINSAPYVLVYDMASLQALNGGDLTLNYALATDLDASTATGWQPLGIDSDGTGILNGGTGFSGIFDGLGHAISGLAIDATFAPATSNNNYYVGLFGYSTGMLRDVGLAGGSVTGTLAPFDGSNLMEIGALAGESDGTVASAYATTAAVTGRGAGDGGNAVGGLVGVNGGVIESTFAVGDVADDSDYAAVGGLAGASYGAIFDSAATGAVSSTGSEADVGGLAGYNGGFIDQSHATGTATGAAGAWVGGLVGESDGGDIEQSYATGDVVAGDAASSDMAAAGGLVGYADARSTIDQSYATGTVTVGVPSASFGSAAGGLVGYSESGTWITDAYATGAVTGGARSTIGGLVGYAEDGTWVDQTYATGAVAGGDGSTVGGLVGYNENGSEIDESYATGAVSGGAGSSVGGLVGENDGTVFDAFWDATTTGQSDGCAGDTTCGGGAVALQSSDVNGDYAFAASSYDWNIFTPNGGAPPSSDWLMIDGGTRPFLAFEYSTVVANAHQLQLVAMDPTASYTLAADVDLSAALADPAQMWQTAASGASAYGFVPIAAGGDFSGSFAGQGHAIAGLAIVSDAPTVGLFAGLAGTVSDVMLDGGHVVSTATDAAVGALVGENDGGSISKARSSVAVDGTTALGSTTAVGGLVGYNNGTIDNSYASGAVHGGNDVGGLVGENDGSIEYAYATGEVTGTDASRAWVGGLVGENDGAIDSAYAIGRLDGDFQAAGGVVGGNDPGGTIDHAYWDTTTSGANAGVGTGAGTAIGLATQAWLTDGPVAKGVFDTTNVWVAGYPYPVLKALPYILVDAGGSQTYGGATQAITAGAITDQDGNDASALVDLSGVAFLTSASGTSAVGSSPYVVGGTGALADAGYQVTFDGTATITPAPLTITADDRSKTYGDVLALGSSDFTESGLQNGETVGLVTLTSGGAAATAGVIGSPYAITASNARGGTFDAANYAITYQQGSLTVAPAHVIVTAASGSSTYGDSPADPGLTASGLENGQSVSVLSGLGDSFAITATTAAGGYTLSVTGTNTNTNYIVDTTIDGNWTVAARPITITADGQSRTYGDANPTLTFAVGGDGLVNGDTLSGGLATIANAHSNVGNYAITQGTLAASANYALTYDAGTLAVTARPITITADGQSRTYGDANPTLTFAVGGDGLVNGDTLSGSLATTATATSNVGNYTITQGTLAASGNYALTYDSGTLAVTARPITITADGQSRIYGNANPTLTFAVGGDSLVNGDTLSGSLATTATTTSNVGNYAITQGTLAASANYAVTYDAGTLSVTTRPITITADDQSRIYGNANPTLTFAVGGDGLVNGYILSGSLTTAANARSNVGNYAITQGTLAASGNYALTYDASTLAVTARPITITADGQSRTYGNANPALTFAVGGDGLVNGDTLSGGLATTATTTSNVGNYAITQGTLSASANYAVTYDAGTLAVTARPITITADGQSRTYGNANPALTFAVGGDGLVNGDALSGSLATTATATSNVGNYAITQGTLAASANYALTYDAGTLAVTTRPITITAAAASKIYDGTTVATATPILTAGSLVGGDALAFAEAFADKDAGTGKTIVLSGQVDDGNGGANYAVTMVDSHAGTITPAALTITVDDAVKTYGDTLRFDGSEFAASGLVAGETVGAITLRSAGARARAVVAGSPYAITAAHARGGSFDAANYAIAYVAGRLTVVPRALMVTAAADARIVGEPNPVLTASVTGGSLAPFDADLADALAGYAVTTAATTASPVGDYAISVSGANPNYALTFVAGTLSVRPASAGPLAFEPPPGPLPFFVDLPHPQQGACGGGVLGDSCASWPYPANSSFGLWLSWATPQG
ncbi:MAG TPA: MBG domain-containing protein [Hyphomicrobiales bacterium]|nr:MBG domain-containing protein [Hyphomicrobiales bacterium]